MKEDDIMTQQERRLYLIKALSDEQPKYRNIDIPKNETQQKQLLRSLFNIRMPSTMSRDFLEVQDEYLKEETEKKGITKLSDLSPVEENIYLWQGDITTLECGAVVNAANSGMTGCYVPCHNCIDNCIHTFAGIQLRNECDRIMQAQGYEEPTGRAKLTSAYNLPCDYVLHTVGPIVGSRLTNEHCRLLESCYKSCLATAVKNNINSIAFCCISTGVFGFPQREAAQIAVGTVREFIKTHDIKVIFNVFRSDDYEIYKGLLGRN